MSQRVDQAARITSRVSKGLMLAIALCLVIAAAGFWGGGADQPRVPSLNVQILPEELAQAQGVSDEIFARPLFWSTRRMVEPEPEGTEVQEESVSSEPLEGVSLLGIIAKDGRQVALLAVDDRIERVRDGATVKGWTVSAITEREVQLSSRGAATTLTLEREIHESIQLEHQP